MKIYLVGGAVRDKLLGITPKEKENEALQDQIKEIESEKVSLSNQIKDLETKILALTTEMEILQTK